MAAVAEVSGFFCFVSRVSLASKFPTTCGVDDVIYGTPGSSTSGLKSLEPDTSLPKSTVDDDDDELEALRTAALLSMKVREKRNLSAVNSEAHERSGSYSGYSCLPKHSNERATAPGKPLFSWKQHTRPNLIVIQPVSLEGKEAASPCSASNLVLPQDRWCPKQGQESPASSGTGQSKRRASGKFSHFESSSESEESDDDLLRSGSALSHSDGSIDGHSSDDEQNSTQASSSFRFTQDCLDSCLTCTESKKHRSGRTVEVIVRSVGEEPTDTSERVGKSSSKKLPVHLRLGDASTVSSTRKKKSKRKRSSHDSRAYSVKRKHTSARGLDSNVRRAWLGRDQHCNRRKRMPSGLSDGTP
ncbi:hypothetical protein MRX96_006446 [Rhipicephalus microplus]